MSWRLFWPWRCARSCHRVCATRFSYWSTGKDARIQDTTLPWWTMSKARWRNWICCTKSARTTMTSSSTMNHRFIRFRLKCRVQEKGSIIIKGAWIFLLLICWKTMYQNNSTFRNTTLSTFWIYPGSILTNDHRGTFARMRGALAN